MDLAVFSFEIMGVICCDKGNAALFGEPDQLVIYCRLLREIVVLELNVIIPLAEEISIAEGGTFCTLVIPLQQTLRYLSPETGGEANETLVMVFQKIKINPRTTVKAFGKTETYQITEVFVSDLILAKKHQMIGRLLTRLPIKAALGSHIDLAPDNGTDSLFHAGLVEGDNTIHRAMVSDGKMCLPDLFRSARKIRDAAGTV